MKLTQEIYNQKPIIFVNKNKLYITIFYFFFIDISSIDKREQILTM